ncbi:hypothetical protein HZS_4033 [Henneguya salminicola]|nr:hypothetical protein HZS_4033 [Henneguya salminicola]
MVDGTLMGIEASTGIVLWSISEEESTFIDFSMSKNTFKDNSFYIPSTSGSLYRLVDNNVEIIMPDSSGRTNFNKNYYITSSQQDIITMGINIITGKLYYYCSSSTCFRNSTDEMTEMDYDNLLIMTRTLRVVQMLDISTGEEIIKYNYGNHDIFMYRFPKDISFFQPDLSGLHYDVDLNIIYGVGEGNNYPGEKCWKISMPSAIISFWILNRRENNFFIFQTNLSDILDNKEGKYDLNIHKNYLLSMNRNTQDCQDILFLNVYNNFIFLHKINNKQKYQCKFANIYSYIGIKNNSKSTTNRIIDSLSIDKLKETFRQLSSIRQKAHKDSFYIDDSRHLKVKVSWKAVSLHNLNKVTTNIITNSSEKQEFELIFSVYAFWKEILCLSVVVTAFVYACRRFYRTFRNKLPDKKFKECLDTPLEYNQIKETKQSSDVVSAYSTTTIPNLVTSRYASDFTHIETIGTGGFGVVFKAKNNMDDCDYAIKRVTIPDCVVARKKVIREVQALAKLNHPGIIRFYNSWLETAPSSTSGGKNEYSPNSNNGSTKLESQTLINRCIPSSSFVELSYVSDQIICNKKERDHEDSIIFEYDSKEEPNAKSLWENVESSSSIECSFMRDLSSLACKTDCSLISSCCGHKNCCHEKKVFLYIQMELCHKQTLKSWLFKNQTRDIPESISIFNQILDAVDFVHSEHLMHRDLKPSNIFFAFDGKVKLGDFGLVTRFPINKLTEPNNTNNRKSFEYDYQKTVTRMVGTELYMSPELIESKSYNFKVDIFSLGLIFFELCVPYKTQSERVILLSQAKYLKFPMDCNTLTNDFIQLITLMLKLNPDERPSTQELLTSPLLQRISKLAQSLKNNELHNTIILPFTGQDIQRII